MATVNSMKALGRLVIVKATKGGGGRGGGGALILFCIHNMPPR